jgi:hypothetical protein
MKILTDFWPFTDPSLSPWVLNPAASKPRCVHVAANAA